MSETKSEYDPNYKTDFEIWGENQDFECQDISMSRPPLDLTLIGTNTTTGTTLPIDLFPV